MPRNKNSSVRSSAKTSSFKNEDVKVGHYNIRSLIKFKNKAQKDAYDLIGQNRISFLSGPAGTAKSFLGINYALDEFYKGNTSKIILTRPVVEAAGEKMGFLPGTLHEKISPYMTPLLDFLSNILSENEIRQHMAQKTIEIRPLAFMRGCTFNEAIILADEMQNSNIDQMKMLLTRIGTNTRIILTGDSDQTDLRKDLCCFDSVAKKLAEIEGIGHYAFTDEHIVRDPLITKILKKIKEV
jgi:phosphate starvation-inducible protein PhoH and related proteins